MTKEELINYAVPIAGGTLGILIGLVLFIYPKTIDPNNS